VPPRRSAILPPDVRVRRATRADLAALIALENRVFRADRMSARQWRRHLENPGAEILVAARGGDIVGAAVLFFHRSHRIARLYSIAVSADARGKGLGERLLAAAERAACRRGSTRLRLEVRADNAAAQQIYARRSYRLFGSRPGYYEDGRDALRYEKALVRSGRDAPHGR
jgi:ribosomal protein S18 acetylase RimI-like enzyme